MNRKSYLCFVLLMITVLVMGCNAQDQAVSEDDHETEANQTKANQNTESDQDTGDHQGSEADSFPTGNITMVVPWAPGGANDVSARFMAEVSPKYLDGKELIIVNKEGGGAVIGQTYAAESPPDGYTLLTHTTSAVSNTFTSETTFTVDSFTPIAMYSVDPEILVVPAESEFEDLSDFLEKAKQDKLIFTTPGYSTSHHMATVILEEENGLHFDYSHTEGAPQMIQQLLGQHVDAALMSYGEIQNQIEDGSLRVLGIMSAERVDHMPDVPTFREAGIDMVYGPFRGIAAPSETPKAIVDKLRDIFEKIINDPEYVENMEQSGYEVNYAGPEEYEEMIQTTAEFTEKALPLLEKDESEK